MKFELPKLTYATNALAPVISQETMELHHGKHHAAYVTNLNAAVEKHASLAEKTVEDLLKDFKNLPEDVRQAIVNNGGGHYNHTLFWEIMTPGGSKEPNGTLKYAIAALGGLDKVKELVNDAGMKRFGSGWTWLVVDGGHLKVVSTPNQDCPLQSNQHPVLGIDVWEHAYYVDYRNRRADYLKEWWKVVNWDIVGQKFDAALKSK
ncbi:MAG TPA: superoxide dismutase [Gemmatales bacterium]|nr:superoxide dismutase [Gemmatales bacterium]HMP17401.1 superoxide dismutase [Gemmatales bacterium]